MESQRISKKLNKHAKLEQMIISKLEEQMSKSDLIK